MTEKKRVPKYFQHQRTLFWFILSFIQPTCVVHGSWLCARGGRRLKHQTSGIRYQVSWYHVSYIIQSATSCFIPDYTATRFCLKMFVTCGPSACYADFSECPSLLTSNPVGNQLGKLNIQYGDDDKKGWILTTYC